MKTIKYQLQDLIEPENINALLELFNKTTGFETAILDLEGNVLAKSGWREICTLFHRAHPITSKKCTESDTVLAQQMKSGEKFHAYQCLNGLVDVSVPVIIEEEHVGNLLTGQFLSEKPDMEFFRKQASKYGFDEKKYLEALKKVPIASIEEAQTALEFLSRMIHLLLEKNLQKIKKEEAEKKFRLSEEKFKIAIQSNPDAISISRLDDGVFIDVNKSFKNILGYEEKEVIGKSSFRINLWVNTEDRDRVVSILKKQGFVSNFETEFRKKSGELFTGLMSASLINIEGEKCVFVITRDISEQKKAREELKLSEEKFRLAFKSSPDSVNINTLDGIYVDINEGFTKLTGFTWEDVIGKSSVEIDIWAIPSDREKLVAGLKEKGYVSNLESKFRCKDGFIRTALMSAAIMNINGSPHILSITRDITDLKEAEEELKITGLQLQSIYDSVHDVIFYLGVEPDENYRFLSVNRAFLTATGLKREQVEDRLVDEVIPEPSLTLVKGNYKKAIEEKRMIEWEETTPYPEGLKYGIVNVVPVFDNSGKCSHLVGSVHDITEQKMANDEIKKYASIVAVSPDMMAIVDKNYRYISVNESYIKAYKLNKERRIGSTVSDVFGQEFFNSKLKPQIDRCLTGENIKFQEWIEFPARGKKFMDVNYYPYRDENGKIAGVVVNARDLTEQKKAEETLRESERRFRTLIEQSAEGISLTDEAGNIIAWNDSMTSLTGIAPGEVLGQKIWDVQFRMENKTDKNSEEYKALKKNFTEFLKSGQMPFAGKQMERTLITPNGNEKIIQGSVFPIKTAKGFMLASISRDITRQKMDEEKIKSSEANLKALINNREDYIWSLDRNYRYIVFNSTYADMFYDHYKTACKKGLNALDYLSEDEKTFWIGVCERAFKGEHVRFEYSYDLGKGMQYFQTSINPIYEEDEITGASMISIDITEQVTIAQRFKTLFNYAPVPLWEEDFSGVKKIIDGLKKDGVKNFRNYFDTHPEVIEKCIQSVKILEINQHVLELHEAESKEELLEGLPKIFTQESVRGFKEELIAIAEGKSTAEFDSEVKTLKGNTRYIHLKWNFVRGHEETLDRIYVSTEDITKRKKAEEEIKEIGIKLSEAAFLTKMGYWEFDISSNKLVWSNEVYRIFGIEPQTFDATYEAFLSYVHPADREAVNKAYTNSLITREPYDIVHRVLPASGKIKYVREKCHTYFNEKGEPIRSIGAVLDITDQMKSKKEIAEAKAYFQTIYNATTDAIFIHDALTGKIIDVNQTMVEMYGYDNKEEVLSLSFDQLGVGKSPYSEKEAIALMQKAKSEGPQTSEWPVSQKNGTIFWTEVSIRYAQIGNQNRFVVSVRNIEERKKAEEEIKTINRRLTDILENMSDAFVALDRNWRYTYMNEKAAKMFDRNAKEMIGKHIWTEFPEGVGQPFHLNYEKAMNERVFIKMEEYYPPYNKWFENRINPSNDGIAIFFTDVTLRKKQEEEIRSLNRDLEKRVIERTSELRNANRELEEFAYSISHDLRAPLRSISGFSEIISRRYKNSLNDEALQYFGFIEEAANNMSRLIDDLLRFARLARNSFQKAPIALGEIIDSVLNDLHQDILNQKAVINLPEDFPVVYGDKSLLNQIFSNLLINALTYHKPDKKPVINITVVEKPQKVEIRIQDNGIGIAKEYHQKIFDIFQRLHAQDEYPGTGIGLAIVKKAVNALGASVGLESEVGKGTTFILIFDKQQK